ncbi:MAG: hypothetical protein K6E50_12310 [Lachnospiraceae bacterium]|nr:hypothetical protein [Lachnospiraceae bacterium]
MAEEESKEEKVIGRIEQGFFSYRNVEEAEQAVTEAERISRLEKQLDYNKPTLVMALYRKALEDGVFHTAEGYAYLLSLRQYLEEHKEQLGEAELPGLPVEKLLGGAEAEAKRRQLEEMLKNAEQKLRRVKQKLSSLRIVLLFLLAALIAMLVIAGMSDSPNILNYERVLQDRYASWEEELKEREEAVREEELQLKREQ